MKIGKLDIKKAYYGSKELTTNNAFVGTVPLIDNPPTEWVTFKSNQNGSVIGLSQKSGYQSFWYSRDRKVWQAFYPGNTIILNTNEEIYMIGILTVGGWQQDTTFSITGNVSISGNGNALWNYKDPENALKEACGHALFKDCSGLTDASNFLLPSCDLTGGCYAYMFQNCRNLIRISENLLPATALASDCYYYMFKGCTSLTNIPKLPATELASNCYNYMFCDCSSLPIIQEVLPAKELKGACYNHMFDGCSSVISVPENMLPAEIMVQDCYAGMFSGCTSLQNCPKLPALILESYCYSSMFSGCSSLTTAPDLPATKLYTCCYQSMFQRCTSLTTAPDLPANELVAYCYSYMFYNCSSLISIKCMAVLGINEQGSTTDWTNGVSATGTFIKHVDSSWSTGNNGIPSGWDDSQKEFTGLTFTALEASDIEINNFGGNAPDLWYAINCGSWVHWSDDYDSIPLNQDDVMWIKGNNQYTFSNSSSSYSSFTMTGEIDISGSIISLVNYKTSISVPYCFKSLFYLCSAIKSISEDLLPITSLSSYIYYYMFNGCTGLTSIPEKLLPATKLEPNCYSRMFNRCTGLTSIPEKLLPATKLSGNCYDGMFYGCSGLTTLPEKLLPATDFESSWGCYAYMFVDCTGLTSIPEKLLQNTALSSDCYYNMFNHCTGLTSIPEKLLPATKLQPNCYLGMFKNCTGLTALPQKLLPANELKNGCYREMFSGCSEIVNTPDLLAPDLLPQCYLQMFYNCFKLSSVKCLAVSGINTSQSTTEWLQAVRSTGIFIKDIDTVWPSNYSGIPYGWTIKDDYKGLTFTALENSSIGFHTQNGGNPDLWYAINGGNWVHWSDNYNTISLNQNDIMWVKGNNPNGFSFDNDRTSHFEMTGGIDVTGNIMSLIDDGSCNTLTIPNTRCFTSCFVRCAAIKSISEELLPATTLTEYCYFCMFKECTGLTTLPEKLLPATTLAMDCYVGIFEDCTGLTTLPEKLLPATTLIHGCYDRMFHGCTSLTNTPELPATELANSCYSEMFWNCTSLTSAHELPATTLSMQCYTGMFKMCTALTTAPELPATTLAHSCYTSMFFSCTSLTTAPELPATVLDIGCYAQMFQGCSALQTAPELPAKILTEGCYLQMFRDCTNLNYIKCLAIDNINQVNSTIRWVEGVAQSGNFVKDYKANWPTGVDGIPEGWTVKQVNYPGIKFEAVEDSEFYWSCTDESFENKFYYSSDDGETWVHYTAPISFSKGTVLCLKGDYPEGLSNYNRRVQFTLFGKVKASGNIMSLIDNGACNTTTIPSKNCFYSLFKDCSALITPPELPATTLSRSCYELMFWNCTSLTSAPELPATTLANRCYRGMFNGCTSLTTASSILPATTLTNNCYESMFNSCSSLIYPPILPATTLAQTCYGTMFYECSSLIYPPALPATQLVQECYWCMFYNCKKLIIAPELPATDLARSCYARMFYGCTSLIKATVLPATELANSCYSEMFWNCTSLKYIKCLAVNGINIDDSTSDWVNGVPEGGIFVKAKNVVWPIDDGSGIPYGWQVIEVE